ncbi:MAG: hypothetical protein OXF64_03585 [bacterium]|nr:hypothetical protein [bacterium]MCY4194720.1 hypothetical protein [bacterium]MCY4271508.1 hypothetical protein [bacterium]
MSLTVLCPLALEARAARRGVRAGAQVVRTGMGPDRSRRVGPRRGSVAVLGMGGAVVGGIHPGDVVVATGVSAHDVAPVELPGAEAVANGLEAAGFTVHTGPVVSVSKLAVGPRRRELAEQGAVAVDMESAWLLEHHQGPAAVVRVVTDTPACELRTAAAPARIYRALRTIRRLTPVLAKEVG